jgi:hypothetical protein
MCHPLRGSDRRQGLRRREPGPVLRRHLRDPGSRTLRPRSSPRRAKGMSLAWRICRSLQPPGRCKSFPQSPSTLNRAVAWRPPSSANISSTLIGRSTGAGSTRNSSRVEIDSTRYNLMQHGTWTGSVNHIAVACSYTLFSQNTPQFLSLLYSRPGTGISGRIYSISNTITS